MKDLEQGVDSVQRFGGKINQIIGNVQMRSIEYGRSYSVLGPHSWHRLEDRQMQSSTLNHCEPW